jgi:hypothetical protein
MWETRAIVKLAAVGTSALLALCVSWIFPSPERVRSWYEAFTYYLLFATFLIWLQAILPRRWQVPWRQLFEKHGLALGLAGVLTLCFVMISPPKFRIFNDEPVLASTALAMYQDHAVFSPLEGRHTLGSYEFPSQSVEKRPLFFPFFVSLAHTLSGYRPENVFAVNALAAGIGLFVFYLLLSQWLPAFWGRLGMLLLASFPLLATYSTSGGFDVPNLLFVLLGPDPQASGLRVGLLHGRGGVVRDGPAPVLARDCGRSLRSVRDLATTTIAIRRGQIRTGVPGSMHDRPLRGHVHLLLG